MTEGNLVSFRVDFNAVDERGWVKTRRQFSGVSVGGLQPGLVVVMIDHDNNTCLGVITEVGESLVRLQPILETWKTGFRLVSVPTPQLVAVAPPLTMGSDARWQLAH